MTQHDAMRAVLFGAPGISKSSLFPKGRPRWHRVLRRIVRALTLGRCCRWDPRDSVITITASVKTHPDCFRGLPIVEGWELIPPLTNRFINLHPPEDLTGGDA